MKNLVVPEAPHPFKPPQELVSEVLAGTYQKWLKLAGARFAPARKEIVPADFKSQLSEIFLIEVVGDGFRLSLAGDTVMRFLGSEFKAGMLLAEVSRSPFQERSLHLFRHCVDTKAPVGLGPVPTLHDQRNFLDIEALILPLSDNGVSVTGLMGNIHLKAAPGVPAAVQGAP